MQLTNLITISLPILGALAVPLAKPGEASTTTSAAAAASSTSCAPLTSPTAPYTVISSHSGSAIHLLPMNAAGEAFYLGGAPATYCPLTDQTQCPPGDATAFSGLGALDVEVPGGQLVYVAPGGALGFTQAHSASYPPGSVLAPFTYIKDVGAQFGDLSTNAFGASGFMACPNNGAWQVFAAIADAVVPTGNVGDCLGFDALTSDYTEATFSAWEYT